MSNNRRNSQELKSMERGVEKLKVESGKRKVESGKQRAARVNGDWLLGGVKSHFGAAKIAK
jgi:hypothetical protein